MTSLLDSKLQLPHTTNTTRNTSRPYLIQEDLPTPTYAHLSPSPRSPSPPSKRSAPVTGKIPLPSPGALLPSSPLAPSSSPALSRLCRRSPALAGASPRPWRFPPPPGAYPRLLALPPHSGASPVPWRFPLTLALPPPLRRFPCPLALPHVSALLPP